jgi:hypothetical protein
LHPVWTRACSDSIVLMAVNSFQDGGETPP